MIPLLRTLATILLLIPMLYLIGLNLYVYRPAPSLDGYPTIRADVVAQLRGLQDDLDHGADEDMQRLYPEGYIFLHALHALGWCAIAERATPNDSLYAEAHRAIAKSYDLLDSDHARETFDPSLSPEYGVFYQGWRNYVLARWQAIQPATVREQHHPLFVAQCDTLAAALSREVFPASYYSGAWPADALVGVASLAWHDRLYGPRHQQIIDQWKQQARLHLDSDGLLPHQVSPHTFAIAEGARGSSHSLMLIFLHDIDPQWAFELFHLYHQQFMMQRLGLPVVREYPQHTWGWGDVDSGPVVLQAGAAASIVGIRTYATFHQYETASTLLRALDGMAIPLQHNGQRRHLFGKLPMADAFMAWSAAALLPQHAPPARAYFSFHGWSFFIIALLTYMLMRLYRRRHTVVMHVQRRDADDGVA